MCINTLTISSKIKNYDVCFESNSDFFNKLSSMENSVFIVDKNVWNLYKDTYLSVLPEKNLIVQNVCEDVKNIKSVCDIYSKIMEFAPKKNITLIAIGGGIIQDITGFVASTLYRGINWIFVPTTLLAQADSCIGAKTSLNFNHYKNLIGTFYPPSRIYIFPAFLNTLSELDFYSGLGEMAKLHLMNGENDTQTFIKSLKNLKELDTSTILKRVYNCLNIKKDFIENDEFDTGRRNLLNYGHCFGHAIETAVDFSIPHGQAVILGMILANVEAKRRKLLSDANEKFILENVLKPILKVEIPCLNQDKILTAMAQDKKNIGENLALVMLKDNYKMEKVNDLAREEVIKLLECFNELNNAYDCKPRGGGF